PEDAARMFRETGCDAVMIGRAALGNPWIFREVSGHLLDGGAPPPPEPDERLEITLEHARLLALQEHGSDAPETPLPGLARGQLIHYMCGLPGAAEARRQMAQIETLGDVACIVEGVREQCAA